MLTAVRYEAVSDTGRDDLFGLAGLLRDLSARDSRQWRSRKSGNKTPRSKVFSSEPDKETDMSDEKSLHTRRSALKCMAFGGAGTLFALAGGVLTPIELAVAAADKQGVARLGKPLFVQISDTHIGFNKDVNPEVSGTLTQTIDLVNGMSEQPALI